MEYNYRIFTIDKVADRVLSACAAATNRVAASATVAILRESRQERINGTVPIVQSQQSASGSASSHAFKAGR